MSGSLKVTAHSTVELNFKIKQILHLKKPDTYFGIEN